MAFCSHCGAQTPEGAASCPSCQKPLQGSAKGPSTKVWIGVAVGCGCVGLIFLGSIFSAIVIPNLLDALQKAKQKRTMADMRNIGTAMVSWLGDEISEGRTDSSLPAEPTIEDLRQALVPAYLAELPESDGWGHPFEYRIDPDLGGTRVLRIRSPGRDGVFQSDRDDDTDSPFPPTEYDQDIFWVDGYFVRYPKSRSGG